MIKMLRALFGLQGESGNRMVVGQPVQVDVKDVQHIRDSNTRLAILLNLQNKYKGTAHEPKFRAVYEKTKRIHNYLVSKKRIHELELFHLQNTEHFINTFSVIIDVHQRHETGTPVPSEQPAAEPERRVQQPASERVRQAKPVKYVTELARRVRKQSPVVTTADEGAELPVVAVPLVALDTYSRIVYVRESTAEGAVTKEIGFGSTELEKDAFLQHVSSRLGLDKKSLSYAGNAMLSVPSRDGAPASGYMPVINWIGFSYALSLTDYRLFPVSIASE